MFTSIETEIVGVDGEEAGTLTVSMSDVLFFACGGTIVPPLGFEKQPCIDFHTKLLPEANTCGPVLHLPINAVNYDDFRKSMVMGITNSPYFDLP